MISVPIDTQMIPDRHSKCEGFPPDFPKIICHSVSSLLPHDFKHFGNNEEISIFMPIARSKNHVRPSKSQDHFGYTGNTKVIEIIPEKDKYRINIIIELPGSDLDQDNGIYMGIDPGVNNLITCHVSTGKSYIVSGRQLLSINRYYEKTIGYYRSIARSVSNSIVI